MNSYLNLRFLLHIIKGITQITDWRKKRSINNNVFPFFLLSLL